MLKHQPCAVVQTIEFTLIARLEIWLKLSVPNFYLKRSNSYRKFMAVDPAKDMGRVITGFPVPGTETFGE